MKTETQYLEGIPVRIVEPFFIPNFRISNTVVLTEEFRKGINSWTDKFFGGKYVNHIEDDVVIKLDPSAMYRTNGMFGRFNDLPRSIFVETLVMNRKTYEKLRNRLEEEKKFKVQKEPFYPTCCNGV